MSPATTCCRWWALWLALSQTANPVAATEVFKWRDAQGHIHFDDRPVQADAESLTIRPGPSTAANANSQKRLQQVLDGFAKEREARDTTRTAEQQAAEQHERACTLARSRQHAVEHANFLYDYTAQGERRVIEGAEYKRAIENARQSVADSCD